MKIAVGDKVPVQLQLPDGETGFFPQAEIRDSDDNLLTTLDLAHVAEGNYKPSSDYTMPNEDFIVVLYITYSDSGHTTEATQYARVSESFAKEKGLQKNFFIASKEC